MRLAVRFAALIAAVLLAGPVPSVLAGTPLPPGFPQVPPELGGPGFTGAGWQTATASSPGSPNAVKGGTLRLSMPEFPATLRLVGKDSNSVFLSSVGDLIYEALLRLDPNTLEIVPGLATHWKISDDKMTFSFRINPDARWADGMPVTADDVVATWRLRTDEGILMPYDNMLFGKYEEPRADSPYIFHVTTKEENWRHFLYFAISMQLLPAHVIGGMSGAEYLEKFQFNMVMGSGPYELKDANIDRGHTIKLTRRPDYWNAGAPENVGVNNFDTIDWQVVLDERLTLEKFKKGELDAYVVSRASWWATEFDFAETQRGLIQKRRIYNEQVQGVSGMAMNMRKPPFDDIRVRRALAMLYDRDKLIEKLFYNEYLKLKSYHPSGPYENPANKMVDYNPAEAVRLLAEAGWKNKNAEGWLVNDKGDVFELTLTFDTPSWERIHTVLQEDLARVGIKLNLKQMTQATQFKNTMEHNFIVTFQSWGGLFWPNPNSSWHSSNADPENTTNITGVKDEEIDRLAALYDREYDQKKREQLIQQMDARLMELSPYALAWYGPFTRLAWWNRFGYPDGYLSRTGRYLAMQSLWYLDPARQRALDEAIKDPARQLPVPPLEDRYWLTRLGKS